MRVPATFLGMRLVPGSHVVLALAVAGLVLGSAAPAAACSCAGEPQPAEALRSADVVFEGTVVGEPEAVNATLGIEGYTGAVLFRFEVARYFKGQQGPEAAIYTVDQDSACGRFYMPGTPYLVYGRLLADGTLTDSLCSRSRPLSAASQDLALLGEGTAPDPGVTPRDVVVEQTEGDDGCSAAAAGARAGGPASAPSSVWSAALLLSLALVRRRGAR